jgi:hypothetical protein
MDLKRQKWRVFGEAINMNIAVLLSTQPPSLGLLQQQRIPGSIEK